MAKGKPTEDERKIFARRLGQLLNENGDKQVDLANRLGISSTTVNNWLRELSLPQMATMHKIASIYHVPFQTLIDEEADTSNEDSVLCAFCNQPDEIRMLRKYLSLEENDRKIIRALVERLSKTPE